MRPRSRRALLQATASLTALSTAGCLGFGGPRFEANCEEGTLATGEGTEENEPVGRILAFDGATGVRRWTFTTRGIPAGEGGPYAGTRGSLAVGDGTLFACTHAGDLYAIADP